jgi:hypothetical protein
MYTEHCKTLRKKIFKIQTKDSYVCGLEELIWLKCLLPKVIYIVNVIPTKIPRVFFIKHKEKNPKFLWNHKRL